MKPSGIIAFFVLALLQCAFLALPTHASMNYKPHLVGSQNRFGAVHGAIEDLHKNSQRLNEVIEQSDPNGERPLWSSTVALINWLNISFNSPATATAEFTQQMADIANARLAEFEAEFRALHQPLHRLYQADQKKRQVSQLRDRIKALQQQRQALHAEYHRIDSIVDETEARARALAVEAHTLVQAHEAMVAQRWRMVAERVEMRKEFARDEAEFERSQSRAIQQKCIAWPKRVLEIEGKIRVVENTANNTHEVIHEKHRSMKQVQELALSRAKERNEVRCRVIRIEHDIHLTDQQITAIKQEIARLVAQ
jgi:hypothetical protein